MRRHSLPAASRSLRASNDRWLFGYADIVTLLFACFATLYAGQATSASQAPMAHDITLPRPDVPASAPVDPALVRDLQAIADDQSNQTSVEIDATSRGLVLSLAEAGSFPTGSADLTPAARGVMLTVATALRRVSNLIRVEGHTDDSPIRTALFASNWELSTARATHVVQWLSDEGGLAPERLSAAGYAEFRPRVPNDSPDQRARNRRVDIVVLGAEAARGEAPGAQP